MVWIGIDKRPTARRPRLLLSILPVLALLAIALSIIVSARSLTAWFPDATFVPLLGP